MKNKMIIGIISSVLLCVAFYVNQLKSYTTDGINVFVFSFSLAFGVVLVFVSFFRKAVFRSWAIFATWWTFLSVLLMFLAPEYTPDFITPFDKKLTALWTAILFFLISLTIIIIKSWKLRGK